VYDLIVHNIYSGIKIMSLEQVVYRAKAKATGGRDGRATSSDGVLDVQLGVPKEMGGAGGEVTNPEHLRHRLMKLRDHHDHL
jgi:hypothetical protein